MPVAEFNTYAKRLSRAVREADTNPTQAQREAGNHRVGYIHMHGLDIAIQVPKDALRKGINKDGKEWSRRVTAHYGHIRRTRGVDGDPVDVFVGEHPESQLVFSFEQLDENGELNEHKVVLGTRNINEAKKIIESNYPSGWMESRIGEIRGYTMEQFKDWLKTSNPVKDTTNKAAAIIQTLLSLPRVTER